MNINFILLTLTLIFSVKAKAIYGGYEVNQMVLNHVVNIKHERGLCSGSIVSPNTILSAAHCMDMFGAPEFAVLYNPDGPPQKCDISNIIDTAYAPNAEAILPLNVHAPDLLLLKLEKPLCSGNIAIFSNESLKVGDEVLHTGYGAGSGVLYETNEIALKIIGSENVSELTTNTSSLTRRLLQTGIDYYLFAIPVIENTTACHGDSGGPVYLRNNNKLQIFAVNGAVLSNQYLGADSCNQGYLHMISPVKPYLKWIQLTIEFWSE